MRILMWSCTEEQADSKAWVEQECIAYDTWCSEVPSGYPLAFMANQTLRSMQLSQCSCGRAHSSGWSRPQEINHNWDIFWNWLRLFSFEAKRTCVTYAMSFWASQLPGLLWGQPLHRTEMENQFLLNIQVEAQDENMQRIRNDPNPKDSLQKSWIFFGTVTASKGSFLSKRSSGSNAIPKTPSPWPIRQHRKSATFQFRV